MAKEGSFQVLLVDDELAHVAFIKDYFEAQGALVEVLDHFKFDKSRGREWLLKFDLIVLDLWVSTSIGGDVKLLSNDEDEGGMRIANWIRVRQKIPMRVLPVIAYSVVADEVVLNKLESLEIDCVPKGGDIIGRIEKLWKRK